MRLTYRDVSLITAIVLVASMPSAFAVTTTFTTFSCSSYPLSSHDYATCYSQHDADVYSSPDRSNDGNEHLYMYDSVSITAPDTATLSGISATMNGGDMYLDSVGTSADANVEAWLSDPSCSPSYLCALSSVYSPEFSATCGVSDCAISSQSLSGPNRNYGISTSGTYYVVEYLETHAHPSNANGTYSQILAPGHGVANVQITITR